MKMKLIGLIKSFNIYAYALDRKTLILNEIIIQNRKI